MATKITQNLLETTLQKKHIFINIPQLSDNLPSNKHNYYFYSMNGYFSSELHKGGTPSVFLYLYKLVNGSWQKIGGIQNEDFWDWSTRYFSKNIDPGYYRVTAWANRGTNQGSFQNYSVYLTKNEPHIKNNKLRVIKNDFTGYTPKTSNTIITAEALYDGRVCTY